MHQLALQQNCGMTDITVDLSIQKGNVKTLPNIVYLGTIIKHIYYNKPVQAFLIQRKLGECTHYNNHFISLTILL